MAGVPSRPPPESFPTRRTYFRRCTLLCGTATLPSHHVVTTVRVLRIVEVFPQAIPIFEEAKPGSRAGSLWAA